MLDTHYPSAPLLMAALKCLSDSIAQRVAIISVGQAYSCLLTSIFQRAIINNNNMNARNQGRKKYEGSRRMYTVADDAHAWIMEHGGGKYLTEIVRAIIANENMRK